MWKLLGVLICLCALTGPLHADDGAASMPMGSVVFVKNTSVRMKSEDLYISPTRIHVRFEFANDTNSDVETVVAFPLPDIDVGNYWTESLGTITDDPVNFVGFTAEVNGAPIKFQVEQRAISLVTKKDVTPLVTAAGLPVNMLTRSRATEYVKLLKSLPQPVLQKLLAEKVLDPGWQGLPGYPYWIMRTRFYWTQRFPAHSVVTIEHSYQPISGSWNSASYFSGDEGKKFCVDAQTKAAVDSLARREDSYASNTDYILKTARTWNGPIGHFHLTLDKAKPGNVLSLCWNGALRKTGATTYEFAADNYVPEQDIHLLVLEGRNQSAQ